MLSAVQIKPDVYWVGALDWNAREFHGYTTEAGITYNAYLIIDEKVTLIDTAKVTFVDELVQRISSVIDPAKIDVLIANHVEMDHSGSTPAIHELAPNAQIYCSAPQGVKNMTAHFGDLGYNGVKTGDTLCIGKRTLAFVQTPMVHWPDNMVTYDAFDKILFSNDAFGQHFASSARFDDENDMCEVMHQAHKYYANIVRPYRAQAAAAVKAVRGLGPDALDMDLPGAWRHLAEPRRGHPRGLRGLRLRRGAGAGAGGLRLHVALHREDRALAGGTASSPLAFPRSSCILKENHISNVMDVFMDCRYVCVGSPTLNSQMLPTVAAFLTYMRGLSPKNDNRVGLAFGSYWPGRRSGPTTWARSSRPPASSCPRRRLPSTGSRVTSSLRRRARPLAASSRRARRRDEQGRPSRSGGLFSRRACRPLIKTGCCSQLPGIATLLGLWCEGRGHGHKKVRHRQSRFGPGVLARSAGRRGSRGRCGDRAGWRAVWGQGAYGGRAGQARRCCVRAGRAASPALRCWVRKGQLGAGREPPVLGAARREPVV